MDLLIVLAALAFLIFMAYKGFSVIIFAPVAAMGAVLLVDPTLVAPMFTGLFMEKMVEFLRNYFPVFLLGALFGKTMEISGFAKSIVEGVIRLFGTNRAMLTIVVVCAILTYGGVSLFVVVFAVYPFAAELFRQSDIPKRLLPATIALGAFTFTMDALPGAPQIQNIIPTTFFGTTTWAAPVLGTVGGVFILVCGLAYLEWRRKVAARKGEGYGAGHIQEPKSYVSEGRLPSPWIALLPLIVVGVANRLLTVYIPRWYGPQTSFDPSVIGDAEAVVQQTSATTAIWAVQAALLLGTLTVLAFAWRPVVTHFRESSQAAVSGAMLAATNTASEYGFGAVIAALPGFLVAADGLRNIPNPLVNEAITVTSLSAITGSASGGMSIALAAMGDQFIAAATQAGIPLEVFHRVASMASGGMDTLPHNGAIITLLAVTGLTHRVAYKDIFVLTLIKSAAVFVAIAVFYVTGLV